MIYDAAIIGTGPAGLSAAERGIARALLVLDRIRVNQRKAVRRAAALTASTPSTPSTIRR